MVLPVVLSSVLSLASVIPVAAQTRVAERLLVKPKARLTETGLAQRLTSRGAQETRRLHRSNVRVVSVPEAQLDSTLAALRSDPEIEFAEPDFVGRAAFLPNDPQVQSGAAWHLARMRATDAWDYTIGTPGTIVAVLDSGVSVSHPDLQGRLLAGYDFVNSDADATDDFGHGTAVAGAIAATGNNGLGAAGVAFGCRVLPVKVMGPTGYAYYSAVAEGIRYAVDNGARVINISIAGDAPSATLQGAIDYAWGSNVVVVAAAGNNANSIPLYPAACDHVVSVGATDETDLLASFSSYGSQVRLTAPGNGIWTTQRSAEEPFGPWRGTSFASPLVAGAAALLASAKPELSNADIVSLLEESAEDFGPTGRDDVYGFGRVNVLQALLAAGAQVATPSIPSPAPQVTLVSPGRTINLGQEVTLAAATAGAGISLVEFYANDWKLLGFAAPPYELEWSPAASGDYSVIAVAVDTQGQRATSAPVVIQVLATPATARLGLIVVGSGTVTPALDGQLLEIGRTYTLRARPSRDQIFAGWEGAASLAPTLTFTMREGLELSARFVPSPFLNMRGNFYGLIANAEGVAPESSGAFTLTLARLGGFSGRLQLAGRSHGFRGQFDLNGHARVTVLRAHSAPVQLELTLNLSNGGTEIAGRVRSGGWASDLLGHRNVFNATLNPAPQAGSVDFMLAGAMPVTTTVATGANRISPGGKASARGTLLDGRKFARGAGLSHRGDFPLYLALAGGSEIVIGWVNFSSESGDAASGTVVWARSGTNAFATTLQATGLR
jgi:subtilisin family serine protease